MSNVLQLIDLDVKERPAHVRFERRAVEDKAETLKRGQYTAKDVDYVTVTAVGNGGNGVIFKVDNWFTNLQYEVSTQRIPQSWVENYKRMYEMWKQGQELPLNGTPLRGWLAISPAMQENAIRAGLHTVEDLAAANSEALQRVGMGGLEAKNKALAHLKAIEGPGRLVQENAALKTEMEVIKASNATLAKQIEELTAMVRAQQVEEEPRSKKKASQLPDVGG